MTTLTPLEGYLKSVGVFCSFSDQPINRTVQPAPLRKETRVIEQPVLRKDLVKENPNQSKKEVRVDLSSCKTLEDLRAAVDQFHDCLLRKTATNTVFSDGISHAPILVIGEAPGAEEDQQGKPFVGQSGQLVDKMFQTIGLSRNENLYITNNVFWRPPGNRQPTDLELEQCYPYLERHIFILKPKVIVLLGGVAAKNLLKTNLGIAQLRERMNTYKHPDLEDPIPVFAFYHPAYLLRSPRQKGTFWLDLLRLKRFINDQLKLTTSELKKAS